MFRSLSYGLFFFIHTLLFYTCFFLCKHFCWFYTRRHAAVRCLAVCILLRPHISVRFIHAFRCFYTRRGGAVRRLAVCILLRSYTRVLGNICVVVVTFDACNGPFVSVISRVSVGVSIFSFHFCIYIYVYIVCSR